LPINNSIDVKLTFESVNMKREECSPGFRVEHCRGCANMHQHHSGDPNNNSRNTSVCRGEWQFECGACEKQDP
jgi:hypothetical protein